MKFRRDKSYHPSAIEQAEKRAWNEIQGFHRDHARRLFILAVVATLVAGAAVGWSNWLASQSKVIPFVINQNNMGESAPVRRLEASVPDLARMKGHMKTWVTLLRSVYADNSAARHMVEQVYAWTDTTTIAKDQLDEFYIAHQPAVRAKKETVDVDVASVIPQGSGNIFQIDWQETAWPRESGHPPSISTWRMIATVRVAIPQTDAEIMTDWDGVFVVNFHVQQLSGGEQS